MAPRTGRVQAVVPEAVTTVFGRNRDFYDPCLIALSVASLLGWMLLVSYLDEPYKYKQQPNKYIQFFVVSIASGTAAFALTFQPEVSILSFLFLMLGNVILSAAMPRLTPQGVMTTSATYALMPMTTIWGYIFIIDAAFPDWVVTLFWIGLVTGIATLPISFYANLPDASMYTHCKWRRPIAPRLPQRSGPMASFHFCCYAEPPDMVIEVSLTSFLNHPTKTIEAR